jgi:hypothetical protein
MIAERDVEPYIEDPTRAYADWSRARYHAGAMAVPPGEPVGGLDDFRRQFQAWFSEHGEAIQLLICGQWEYPKKKASFARRTTLVAALASYLFEHALGLAGSTLAVTTAAILVQEYLDKLCEG